MRGMEDWADGRATGDRARLGEPLGNGLDEVVEHVTWVCFGYRVGAHEE
jgi:hypothetical protein